MPIVGVKFLDDNLCSQKCLVPWNLFDGSGLRHGDIVSIYQGPCRYVCCIFVLPPTSVEKRIIISDAVSCHSELKQLNNNDLLFPEAFNVEKTTTFKKLIVDIVFKKMIFDLNTNHYQNIVSSLLNNIVICKGASVSCSSMELAKMFSIVEIKIEDTYHSENICGKISRAANLNIRKFSFPEEISKLRGCEVTCNYDTKVLSNLIDFHKMVIITGPSGCGKSVIAKKVCLDLQCDFLVIEGSRKHDLTAEKCGEYFQYLVQCSKNSNSILLIDQIDKFSQSSLKLKPSPTALLIKLVQRMITSNVYIIATAVKKNLVHPSIADFFEEVPLGVLSVKQRKEILKATLKLSDDSDIDLDYVASLLQSFVACDIVQLCDEKVVKDKEPCFPNESCTNVLKNEDFENALLSFTPSLLKNSVWNMKVKPVHWNEIGGMNWIKKRLQMCVEKPLLHPDIFEEVGLHCPNGVLLFGPPGCCKTTLARGLATECKANFFAANPSQIYSAYVGESEKNICELFYQARLCPPSIIFLDELDSLVGSRDVNSKQQGVAEKVLSTLLNEMDGSSIKTDSDGNNHALKLLSEETSQEEREKRNQVIVVAATNRPDCIDSALLRPGRFDVILYIPPPNYEERISILETITKDMPLVDIDFNIIAEKTEYFTGADLKNLVSMAAMNAFREDIINSEYIRQDHFTQALLHTKPSITKEQISLYEQLSIKYGLVMSDECHD